MENYQEVWADLTKKLGKQFDGDIDLTEALYLVGVQELGEGFKEFSKAEKMDLIHLGNCRALSYAGYYQLVGVDQDNWPVYEKLEEPPKLLLKDQEALIKKGIISFFLEIGFI